MENKYKAGDVIIIEKDAWLQKYTFRREGERNFASSLEPVEKVEKPIMAIYIESAEGHYNFSNVLVNGLCYAVYNSFIKEGESYAS